MLGRVCLVANPQRLLAFKVYTAVGTSSGNKQRKTVFSASFFHHIICGK